MEQYGDEVLNNYAKIIKNEAIMGCCIASAISKLALDSRGSRPKTCNGKCEARVDAS